MREKDRMKFVNLANKRVNRALKTIQLIGNLSDRSNYDYTREDVEKIFQALRAELKRCEERFSSLSAKDNEAFRLE
jgi:uncharacterized protein YeeX (DUF496 family)